VEHYLELARAAASEDMNNLSQWWRQHDDTFPAMYEVAMERCIIPAGSAACELQPAGRELTELRSRTEAHTLRPVVIKSREKHVDHRENHIRVLMMPN
jgi:hypothetical protein